MTTRNTLDKSYNWIESNLESHLQPGLTDRKSPWTSQLEVLLMAELGYSINTALASLGLEASIHDSLRS